MVVKKRHSEFLTEVFPSESEYEKHESECKVFANDYADIVFELKKRGLKPQYGFSSFCPKLQFFSLDAPYTAYIQFKVDLEGKVIETDGCGHIELTEADRKKSYLYMCSVKNAHKANGGVWMRKSKYKSAEDLAKKVEKFWKSVMESLEQVTEGYPYKKMKVNIY